MSAKSITVAMLAADYLDHCRRYYPAKPNNETAHAKVAISYLTDYLSISANDLSPLKLKAVRELMIATPSQRKKCDKMHSRAYVNRLVRQLVRMVRWGVENELVDASVHHGLKAVTALKRGRCEAPETDRILPVCDVMVAKTLLHCSRTVGDMIRIQRLAGMRPAEVCLLTPKMIDRSGKVWIARIDQHKGAWRGKTREVYLGPKSQAVLMPYLLRPSDQPLFSPREAEQKRRDILRDNRVTPTSWGNSPGSNVKEAPKKQPRESYDTHSYRRAIHTACAKAFDRPEDDSPELESWKAEYQWSPNRLRHTAATEVRKAHGLEAAQLILGHATADITQVYAETDRHKAMEVALMIG